MKPIYSLFRAMGLLRTLLLPFSWLYGIGVFFRNKFYDWGVFSTRSFSIPVISIGNLTAGGTGKTPHVEYLVRLLGRNYKVATLSRGYGRLSKGFLLAKRDSPSIDIGDEPKQYVRKFDHILVAVDADRVHGIKKLQELEPGLQVVLLDDAFQHRAVKADLSILLTDHGRLYYRDRLLPSGLLREPVSGALRADVIIVTKTPDQFTPMEQRIILKEIKPRPHQLVFFSYITYGEPISYWDASENVKTLQEFSKEGYAVLLLTGIANPLPMKEFLGKHFREIKEMTFPDHHEYSVVDLERLKALFHGISNPKKVIMTTEKDAMRLDKPGLIEFIKGLPIVYIPIQVRFRDNGEQKFDQCIFDLMKR
jgi:tetraacyldisaccharide 4'-kinase